MKKSTITKGILLFVLLISAGVIAVVVFGNDPQAKTESDSNKL